MDKAAEHDAEPGQNIDHGRRGLDSENDVMELLRTLPFSILYCGFVKIEAPGVPGVWMRTYGAQLSAGHTIEVEDDQFLRFHAPGAGEKFFSDEEDLLIVEIVGPGDMKR